MKSLFLAASAASLLILAGPAMAQGYGPMGTSNPYDGPMHNAPDNGPQMRHMESTGSTVLDRTPYNEGDAGSDRMSEARHTITLVPPPPEWQPH